MLLGRFNSCSIVCPPAVTGGVEAIHQLAELLNGFGVECWITYWNGKAERSGHRLSFEPFEVRARSAYAHYHPVSRWETELRPDHLVILPELLHNKFKGFAPASVAIWWLSIDNAFRTNRRLLSPEWRDGYFRTPDLIHFHQSVYAREFLRRHGAHSLALGDYTDRRFTAVIPRGPGGGDRVCFNPAKGLPLAQAFFDRHDDVPSMAIDGMGKPEVFEAFSRNPLYIDFGHFPGRDRMPREAAAAGAIVFLHNKGAGAVFDDFPVPDFYRFEEADVASGALYERVRAVLADRETHWRAQATFREEVRWERAGFRDQVCKLMGLRRDV